MYLEKLLDVANDVQADSLTFHNLIFVSRELLEQQKVYDNRLGCTSGAWEGFLFEPGIEPQALYEKMKNILSGKYRFRVDFYPNFSYPALEEYYKDPHYKLSEYSSRCVSPWMVAYIFPDGEVRPCLNSDYSFGNIKKDKFSKVWNSGQALRFRRLLKENQIFPLCVRCTELYRY